MILPGSAFRLQGGGTIIGSCSLFRLGVWVQWADIVRPVLRIGATRPNRLRLLAPVLVVWRSIFTDAGEVYTDFVVRLIVMWTHIRFMGFHPLAD